MGKRAREKGEKGLKCVIFNLQSSNATPEEMFLNYRPKTRRTFEITVCVKFRRYYY